MINDEQDINDTEVFTKLSIEILKKHTESHQFSSSIWDKCLH